MNTYIRNFGSPQWLRIWAIVSVSWRGVCLRFCRSGLLFSSVQFGILLVMVRFGLSSPLWAMCTLIFIGTNGETYFNTVALVSCVQNFLKNRGPVVGILKGFAGLGGAILIQIYAVMNSPDHTSLILMVAVGPTMVVISLMFIVKPVGGHKQIRSSDGFSFFVIYCICLILASYLMGVILLEDIVDLSYIVVAVFTVILIVILLIPIAIPITLSFHGEPRTSAEEALLPDQDKQGPSRSEDDAHDIIFSDIEDEKPGEVDMLPASERLKRIA